MTCIVGYADGKRVIIGGDSAGVDTSDYSLMIRADEKVFILGDFIFGFTTSYRMGQLLRYNLTTPKYPRKMDTMTYMVKLFIPAVRKCLADGGFATKIDDAEYGGNFLVGYRGELFEIQAGFQVVKSAMPFNAVGCGGQLAVGSLYTTRNDESVNEDKVRIALEAAAANSAGVRPPFVILEGGELK